MFKKLGNFFLAALYLLLFISVFFVVWKTQNRKNLSYLEDIPSRTSKQFMNSGELSVDQAIENNDELVSQGSLPNKFLLQVPFQSQAPFGDWAEPYQDGCEEASIIMVKYFFQGKPLSRTEMKSEIDGSVSWQEKNWGGHFDLDAKKTLELSEKYFGISGKIFEQYDIEFLKKAIYSGFPIVVPSAGRLLGNPNFSGLGPEYHMLLIIGYDEDRRVFITNDPGTRKGEKYTYKYQVLLDAVSGPRVNKENAIIVLEK